MREMDHRRERGEGEKERARRSEEKNDAEKLLVGSKLAFERKKTCIYIVHKNYTCLIFDMLLYCICKLLHTGFILQSIKLVW